MDYSKSIFVTDIPDEIRNSTEVVNGKSELNVRVENEIMTITGFSKSQIEHLSDRDFAKYAEQVRDRLRDLAVDQNRIVNLSWADKNGEIQNLKIVPASLSTARENAVNDGDPKVNYFMNGQQRHKDDFKSMVKTGISRKVINDILQTPSNIKRDLESKIDKGLSEFGGR